MPYKSKFDPNSDRAVRGLAFQAKVQKAIEPWFQKTWSTRDWLLFQDPCLTDVQLNVLEHTWGDIIVFDTNVPYPVFIECVTLGYENSIFPNHKILKYNGENKFYCFGWDDEMRFVHSKTWNSYVKKCDSLTHYKKFTRTKILNLRNQYKNSDSFCESILQIENM